MQIEPLISYRDVEPQDEVEERIYQRIAKLEQFHDRITSCRVHIAAPPRRGRRDPVYHVQIEVTVPSGSVVVHRPPDAAHGHTEFAAAVRDAFDIAERRLEEIVRRREPSRLKSGPG